MEINQKNNFKSSVTPFLSDGKKNKIRLQYEHIFITAVSFRVLSNRTKVRDDSGEPELDTQNQPYVVFEKKLRF